ncbi:MAG: hypothetical protein ABSE63_18990 [Thermoguttaceae bacterium]
MTEVLNNLKKTGKRGCFSAFGGRLTTAIIRFASKKGFHSSIFPLLGFGSGRFKLDRAKLIMVDELKKMEYSFDEWYKLVKPDIDMGQRKGIENPIVMIIIAVLEIGE